jgi:hypothetical protein
VVTILVRVLSAVALVGGLVLGGLGIKAHQDAAQDEDRAAALVSEADDLREDSPPARRAIVARERAVTRLDRQVQALEAAVFDYARRETVVIVALNEAADRMRAGDTAGAVASVDANVAPNLARLDALIDAHQSASFDLRAAQENLAEVLG